MEITEEGLRRFFNLIHVFCLLGIPFKYNITQVVEPSKQSKYIITEER